MIKKTKKKKISFRQVYMSDDFVNMFDIKRKLEAPDMDRIEFSKFEAMRLKETIFKENKKKKRGFYDDLL